MFNLDPAKLLVILVIAVVFVGPERIPRYARILGNSLKVVMEYRDRAEHEIRKAVPDLGLPHIPRNPSSAVSGYLADLVRPSAAPAAGDLTPSESRLSASEAEPPSGAGASTGERSTASRAEVERDWDVATNDPGMN